jgi:hypothetical protein
MRVNWVVALTLLSAMNVVAQPRQAVLRPPVAALASEFSRVLSVRELLDGRVLVADAGDGRLVVARWGDGDIRSVGRIGQGPREFPRVRPLAPLADDSTLMVDVVSRRWTLLHADSVVRTVSPADAAYRLSGGNVVGVDTLGHYLALVPRSQANESFGDSSWVLLIESARSSIDTVGVLAPNADRYHTGPKAADGRPASVRIVFPALSVGEQAFLTADGYVAIARLNPYRVEWRAPNGAWTRGAPLPFSRTPVDAAERSATRRRLEAAGGKPGYPSDAAIWPSVVPPFQPGALRESPEGYLLIERTPTAKSPDTIYDVIDRAGKLVRRLALSPAERIVGFGRGTVFTVSRDADGLEKVRRHSWP